MRTLTVGLVLVLVVIGLPVIMPGMGNAHCEQCDRAMSPGPVCLLAILITVTNLLALVSGIFGARPQRCPLLVRSSSFDPPPQFAALV